jgi:hypothetical protein
MQALQSRMHYLRNAEALMALGLPLAFVLNWSGGANPDIAWMLRGGALALVSAILLQGALYWHLKIRSIDERRPLPAYFSPLFRSFQYVNLLAIGAMLIALLLADATRADLIWSSGIVAFAILEQINYFHYQLMYDTRAAIASLLRNGRLRKAALALDLAKRR